MTTRPQPESHLDADQLNAFVEGALSPPERALCLQHLAECTHCREIAFLAGAALPEEEPAATPARRFSFAWWPVVSLGAATLAAITIAVLLFHHPRQSIRATPVQIATESPTLPPPAPVVEAPTSQPTPAEPRPHAVPKPSPARRTAPAPAPPVSGSLQAKDAAALDSLKAPTQPAAAAPQQLAGTGRTLQEGPRPAAAPLAQTIPPQPAATPQTSPTETLRTYNGASVLRSPNEFAQIAGTITDSTGAAVSHARVTLDLTAGTAHRETLTDAAGRFTIGSLPPGKYRLDISSPGFTTRTREVDLGTSQLARVDSQLTPGSASETVTVEAAAPAPKTESASVQSVLSGKAPLQTSVSSGSRTLALDSTGKLFLNKKAGKHWKSIHGPWKKSAVTNLSLTPDQAFKVTTTEGSWLSADGEHWHLAN